MRSLVAPGVAVAMLLTTGGCGGDEVAEAPAPARSVQIAAVEYAFRADESITITAGETIEFVVTNEGTIDHEMEVLTDASRRLGQTPRLAPGQSATVVVTFDEAGAYRVICDIDDHQSRGQRADFTVAEPEPAT